MALVESSIVKVGDSASEQTKVPFWMFSGNVTGSKIGLSIVEKVRSGIDFLCDGENKSLIFRQKIWETW